MELDQGVYWRNSMKLVARIDHEEINAAVFESCCAPKEISIQQSSLSK
jgi:hypothetical protein